MNQDNILIHKICELIFYDNIIKFQKTIEKDKYQKLLEKEISHSIQYKYIICSYALINNKIKFIDILSHKYPDIILNNKYTIDDLLKINEITISSILTNFEKIIKPNNKKKIEQLINQILINHFKIIQLSNLNQHKFDLGNIKNKIEIIIQNNITNLNVNITNGILNCDNAVLYLLRNINTIYLEDNTIQKIVNKYKINKEIYLRLFIKSIIVNFIWQNITNKTDIIYLEKLLEKSYYEYDITSHNKHIDNFTDLLQNEYKKYNNNYQYHEITKNNFTKYNNILQMMKKTTVKNVDI